jgi:hypothetical protein
MQGMISLMDIPRNAIATSNAFSPKTGWSERVRTAALALATTVQSYPHLSRSRIDLPITQSLSCSDRNGNSSVKWVMRCLKVALS